MADEITTIEGSKVWLGTGELPGVPLADFDEDVSVAAFFPIEAAEATAPENSEFIAAVAWSLRPGSDRRDGFFVGPSPSPEWRWIPYAVTWDDNWMSWSWTTRAATDRAFETHEQAAAWLLRETWAWEKREWETDLFDEVDQPGGGGVLHDLEVWAIGEATLG